MIGGETGIRTLGTITSSTVFETAPFDHSGTSPHTPPAGLCRQSWRFAGSRKARRLAKVCALAKPKVDLRRSKPDILDMAENPKAPNIAQADFSIGDVVRHRIFEFRGVVFDIDPVFDNSEEWYNSIPEEVRPAKDQPFYHLFAENGESSYVAYVSQQNLLSDREEGPVDHPSIKEVFGSWTGDNYELRREMRH